MIRLRGVCKSYEALRMRAVAALADVDLDVDRGEFVVITGRSAAGKTTLLSLVAGLARPTSGLVEMDGTELWSLSDRRRSELRNATMGFVFQFPSLLPSLSVLQNVLLPLSLGPTDATDTPSRALDLLEMVGLGGKAASSPRQLSAGQQQRVVIARSLINRPRLLLADEPTSNLDEQTETEIMDLLRRIHEGSDLTVLLVTHTRQLVRYGTRHLTMAAGRLSEGPSDGADGREARGATAPRGQRPQPPVGTTPQVGDDRGPLRRKLPRV